MILSMQIDIISVNGKTWLQLLYFRFLEETNI